MSASARVQPWIVVLATLGGLGGVFWAVSQAGRSANERSVAPLADTSVAAEYRVSELVRPDEAGAAEPAAEEDPALAERPGWTPLRLVGRVEQAENERPLADIVVQVTGPDDKAVAGARSDEDGRFEIVGLAPEEVTIRARPRRGFVVKGRLHVVTAEERRGEEEIVLVLARGTSAPVEGIVVNELTQEGVFELRVELSLGELSESVRTDGQGNFATEVAFPPGALSAAVFDEPPGGPAGIGTFRREHLKDGMLGEPWALEVGIGPSFLLDATSGASLGPDFMARIVEASPEPRFAAVLDVHAGGFVLNRDAPVELGKHIENSWPEIPVRPGTPPWIRYSSQHLKPPAEEVAREITLQVHGGGQWIGAAEILTTVGHYPHTIGIPLRACGTVAGSVIDTTETPVKEASVRLFSRGSGSELAIRETKTNDGGAYNFADVDAGLYRLVVQPLLHAGDERELRVEQGPNPLPTVILPPALVAGDVAGELFVAADTPHERPFLTLASAEGSSWRKVEVARVAARDEHGTLYAFRFQDVPSGEFDLAVGHLGLNKGLSNFWTPRKLRVYSPRDGIRFDCRAPDDPEALVFRVTDAAGNSVAHADVTFGPEGFLVGQYKLRGDRVFFLPRGVPLEWTVSARGYRPVRGNASAALRDGDRRVVDVVLKRGWGATLHVLAAPDASKLNRHRRTVYESELFWQATPVVARVYADGRIVGRTDARGRIDLSLAHMPQKIRVEMPGWMGAAVHDMRRGRDEHTEAVLYLLDISVQLQKYR